MATSIDERLTLNVKEAACALGLSRNSVYQACLKGEIPHLRIGKRILIPKAQLERLLLFNKEQESGIKEPDNGPR